MLNLRTILFYIMGVEESSYKNKIYFNGTSNFNKEQTHPLSWKSPHIKHGFGDSMIIGFVSRLLFTIFPLGMSNLRIGWNPLNNNNWTKIGEYLDQGGWGKNGTKCGGKPIK